MRSEHKTGPRTFLSTGVQAPVALRARARRRAEGVTAGQNPSGRERHFSRHTRHDGIADSRSEPQNEAAKRGAAASRARTRREDRQWALLPPD